MMRLAKPGLAKPIRGIFRRQQYLTFKMTEMSGIEFGRHRVVTTHGKVPYDYL
jgi:NADH dehydrogenase FAD-containing subunit